MKKASELAEGHAIRVLASAKAEERCNSPKYSMIAVGTDGDNNELTSEEFALVAALRSSKGSTSSGGAGGSKRKFGLDHDVDAHPDSPTEYEKTLKCDNCSVKGHARRTCKKPKTEHKNFLAVKIGGKSENTSRIATAL